MQAECLSYATPAEREAFREGFLSERSTVPPPSAPLPVDLPFAA